VAEDHWLAGVAKVLRAETDNLRELARIGGVDPRTAYVGTCLDGADLRGQDLRGMVFTDLDLTQVQHDARTMIDPDQVVVDAPILSPSILIATTLLEPGVVARALSGLDPELFGPKDISRFRKQMDLGRPAIVLAIEDDMHVADAFLGKFKSAEIPAVIVVQGRRPLRWFDMWRSIGRSRRVVFTLDQAVGSNFSRLGLASDTRHVINLLTQHWSTVSRLPPRQSIYIRARGVGPSPVLDACAQLYDKIWRSDLQRCGRMMVGPFEAVPTLEWEAVEALLELDHHEVMPLPTPDVAAFLDASNEIALRPSDRYSSDYSSPPIHALQALGQPDRDGRLPEFEMGTRLKAIVEGEPGPTLLGGSIALTPTSGPPIDYEAVGRFTFDKINEVVIHPRADVGWILNRMVTASELWVTSRDMLGVEDPRALTIWNLIAIQLRRIVPQGGGRARQAYLGMILRAAIRRSVRDPSLMESFLDDGGNIKIHAFEAGPGAARFNAALVPHGGRRAHASLDLDIEIGPDGPWIRRRSS